VSSSDGHSIKIGLSRRINLVLVRSTGLEPGHDVLIARAVEVTGQNSGQNTKNTKGIYRVYFTYGSLAKSKSFSCFILSGEIELLALFVL